MQPCVSNNDAAKAKLISMYGNFKVKCRPIGEQKAYLTILRWLNDPQFQPFVKLELHNDQLTLSYIRIEVFNREPHLPSIERAFKHLQPYSMYVSQITRGNQIWKEWRFKDNSQAIAQNKLKALQKKKRRQARVAMKKRERDDDFVYVGEEVEGVRPLSVRNIFVIEEESDSSDTDKDEHPKVKKEARLNLSDYDVSDVIFESDSLDLNINFEFAEI